MVRDWCLWRTVWRAVLVGTLIGLVALAGPASAAPRKKAPANAHDRALVVVLDRYGDARLGGPPAGTAARDAAAIERLLIETLGYQKSAIKVLRNEAATRAAILAGIRDWLYPNRAAIEREEKAAEEAKKKSKSAKRKKKRRRKARAKSRRKQRPARSYLYFAGYGYFQKDHSGDETDGLDETLIPYDAEVAGSGADARIVGMISDDEFAAALQSLEGRLVTVVLDTSHSGVVTRARPSDEAPAATGRSPRLSGAVRRIVSDQALARHKAEGGFVEASFKKGTLTVWSAASPTQTAQLLAADTPDDAEAKKDTAPAGLFTRLYIEGLADKKADRNENGRISNLELLVHLAAGSAAYCKDRQGPCEMGLTPRLEPFAAYRRTALGRKHRRWGTLAVATIMDFLAEDQADGIVLEQIPQSPVKVGDTGIRFRVVSPRDGHLVLLNLSAQGHLVQLFPSAFETRTAALASGRVEANVPLVVPGDAYGITMAATEPGKGHIIALHTRDPIAFGEAVSGQRMGDIPRSEALSHYLPRLAAALTAPLHTDTAERNTRAARWSVATLPYEIVP